MKGMSFEIDLNITESTGMLLKKSQQKVSFLDQSLNRLFFMEECPFFTILFLLIVLTLLRINSFT